ncbi:MAG: aminoglycoside phosphotransferase family protein [Candidatus Dormiibacterota bacterium]
MPTADAFGPDVTVFRRLGRTADERAWLRRLPDLVRRLETRWAVRTGQPYEGGTSSWAAPATMSDGTPAVLKVAWPHREARGESIGLLWWGGEGAPIVYATEPSVYAVLMERCDPGVSLAVADLSPEDGLRAAATVLRKLWVVPPDGHGLERLHDVCAEWAMTVRDRQQALHPPFDPGLVTLGAHLLEYLPASASREVLVHGDANPTNFLAAARQPWLLIDAKPMVGDPGYDVAPLVLQLASPLHEPHPARVLYQRFGLLADALGEPIERLLAWSVARSVEYALWCASRDEMAAGSEAMDTTAVLARLLAGGT